MIDRFEVENYKSLRKVTVDLGRLTVFVGPNGSGKSSTLLALDLLAQSATPGPGDGHPPHHRFSHLFGGRGALTRVAASPDLPVRLGARSSTGDTLRVSGVPTPSLRSADLGPADLPMVCQVAIDGPAGSSHVIFPPHDLAQLTGFAEGRLGPFAGSVLLHHEPGQLTAPSAVGDEVPSMRPDGYGLASRLAWMKGAAEDELATLTAALAEVVPGVRRIVTLRERVPVRRLDRLTIDGQPVWRPVDEVTVHDRFEVVFDDGRSVPSDLVSQGTVFALGLLTAILGPAGPRLVLLDDIDRGLHIEAQAQLLRVLRSLLERDPTLQIVCSTHSPYLLSAFRPAEVRVFALDAARNTHVRSLEQHPDFARWQYGTQTGELWAALGDGWVAAEP